jgi:hypothetical protein
MSLFSPAKCLNFIRAILLTCFLSYCGLCILTFTEQWFESTVNAAVQGNKTLSEQDQADFSQSEMRCSASKVRERDTITYEIILRNTGSQPSESVELWFEVSSTAAMFASDSPGLARPGEKIPCSITFEANIPFEIEKISAVLTGEEFVDFRSSSSGGQSRKYTLHESRQELPLAVRRVPVKVPYEIRGEVVIPEGIPYSIDLMDGGKGMALTWEIEFVIEMKWWPDWRHFETITVQS